MQRYNVLENTPPTVPQARDEDHRGRKVGWHMGLLSPGRHGALVASAACREGGRVEGAPHEVRLPHVGPCLMHEPRVAARGVILLGVHAYPLQDGVHPGGTIERLRRHGFTKAPPEAVHRAPGAHACGPRAVTTGVGDLKEEGLSLQRGELGVPRPVGGRSRELEGEARRCPAAALPGAALRGGGQRVSQERRLRCRPLRPHAAGTTGGRGGGRSPRGDGACRGPRRPAGAARPARELLTSRTSPAARQALGAARGNIISFVLPELDVETRMLARGCWHEDADTRMLTRGCWHEDVGTRMLRRGC